MKATVQYVGINLRWPKSFVLFGVLGCVILEASAISRMGVAGITLKDAEVCFSVVDEDLDTNPLDLTTLTVSDYDPSHYRFPELPPQRWRIVLQPNERGQPLGITECIPYRHVPDKYVETVSPQRLTPNRGYTVAITGQRRHPTNRIPAVAYQTTFCIVPQPDSKAQVSIAPTGQAQFAWLNDVCYER